MTPARDPRWGGRSAETRIKQAHFTDVLRHQVAVGWAALKKAQRERPTWDILDRLIVLDLNGGCGTLGDPDNPDDPLTGLPGSPVIALRYALEAHIPMFMFVFELRADYIDRLRSRLLEEITDFWLNQGPHDIQACLGCPGCNLLEAEDVLNTYVRLIQGDHNVTFWPCFRYLVGRRKAIFGLAYADPYGKDGLPIGPLETLSREPRLKRIDILINLPTMVYKRTRTAGQSALRTGKPTRMVEHADSYLWDDLARIDKRYRWIRAPVGKQQEWTMFFGTNWAPNVPKKSLGFLDITTPDGRAMLDALNLTIDERKGRAS